MSCSVGDRKRIEWAANVLRRKGPTARVDIIAPAEGQHFGWSLEAMLADVDCVETHVYSVLKEEDLDLQLVQPRDSHYRVITTA